MNRKQLDIILITSGAVLSAVLLGAALLANWGESFAKDQIQSQLTQEKIYFPKAGTPALDPAEYPGLQQYAGTQVDSGDKAKAYADEYIWHHMMKSSGGKTYAEVSTLAMASPQDAKLAGLKATLFQGDMLRSSLLTAYAFSRFGVIAHWAALGSLAGAAALFVLVIMGLIHLARSTRRR